MFITWAIVVETLMDFCTKLFALARRSESIKDAELKYPFEVAGYCPPVGSSRFQSFVKFGSSRQFRQWRDQIFRNTVDTLCGYVDPTFLHAHRGLREMLGEFFSNPLDQPALMWYSPVWVLTSNWIAAARLRAKDTTLDVGEHRLGAAGDARHRLTFSSLKHLDIPLSELCFLSGPPRAHCLARTTAATP